MSPGGEIYAVDTRDLGRIDKISSPAHLFRACPDTQPHTLPEVDGPYAYSFDTKDGQRFLIVCRLERPGKFTVLTNWRTITKP
jgi:hypothetical protein